MSRWTITLSQKGLRESQVKTLLQRVVDGAARVVIGRPWGRVYHRQSL
jgi:hypothetical protein